MIALSGGHLAADFASGSVPALIPFLTDRYNLSYTLAALLLLSATVSSSLVQPAFGFWSDRAGALWLIPAGVALAAVGVGGAVVSPAYPIVVLLVFVGGLGVAAFHPEGAKVASFASGEKRASGMSYFNIGGNLGYALGAFVTGLIVAQVGLWGGVLAMIPVLLAAGALIRVLPYLATLVPVTPRERVASEEDQRRAMGLLSAIIGLRSIAWFAVLAFAPLWVEAHGHSKADGNRLLFLMLLSGAFGTILLGPLADAIGLRRTLVLTQIAIPPLILAFVYIGGVAGVAALMLLGVCVVGTYGITMVLSQLYLPRHVGMASGLAIGLAMGIGGVSAVVLGALADAVDLETALVASAVAPAIGVFLCLRLPAPARREPALPAPSFYIPGMSLIEPPLPGIVSPGSASGAASTSTPSTSSTTAVP